MSEERQSIHSEVCSSVRSSHSEDFFTRFNVHSGWKSLLMFQFQTQFSLTVMLSVVYAYVISLRGAAFAIGTYRLQWIEKEYSGTTIHLMYALDLIYFIDLISMIIYKKVDWTDVKYRHKPRNSFLIFIEFLTLIPLDGIYYTLTIPNMKILYGLRLRYAFRIFRLLGYYKRSQNYVGSKSHILHLFIIIFYIIMFVITASAIAHVYSCYYLRICIFHNEDYFKHLFYNCLSKVVMLGQNIDTDDEDLNITGIMFYLSMMAYICNVHLISHFICDIIHLIYEKYVLINQYERLKISISNTNGGLDNLYNADKYLRAISSVYTMFWSKKKGLRKEDIIGSYLPEVKYVEVELDMSWCALKHSHIFRNRSIDYLRYISTHMSHVFYSPGEIIYQKNYRKSRMVYITSGVVEILSEDDNETSIISFSEGTCLGESTLLIDYPATSTVICKDFCEASILEKKHYIQASKLYPDESRAALHSILKRYKQAAKYKNLNKSQQVKLVDGTDEFNMQWLKYILRMLLGIKTHQEDRAFLNRLQHIIPCYKYLDLMVIAKEIELVTDSIFLKATFPFIFQPNSLVKKAWNRFIFLAFVYFSIVYTYYLTVETKITRRYITTHIIITVLWYFDLYLNMSTAVKTRHHFLTTVHDIVMHRLTTYTFVFNLLAALNPGFLFYLMDPTISIRRILLLEINKMLKIYIIEEFFETVDFSTTNTLVRLAYCKCLIYLFYLLFFISAFYHMMACFDNKCSPIYLSYLKSLNFTTPTEYLILGAYSSIKSMCNYQRHKFNRYFNFAGLILILTVLYFYNVLAIAYLSACESLKQYDIQSINEYVRNIKVLTNSFRVTNLSKRINNNVTKKYQYGGINFLYGNTIYKNLPNSLFTIIRDMSLSEFMEGIPFFSRAGRKAIADICSRITISTYPENELIVLGGETCEQMHIILSGYCIAYFGQETTSLGPGEPLSAFEVCLNLPTLRTVYTVTTCQIVSLTKQNYQQVLLTYPCLYYSTKYVIDQIQKEELFQNLKNKDILNFSMLPKQAQKYNQFIFFGSARRKEYNQIFPRWIFPLRFLLIPCTFTPYGRITMYWEISRSIFALMNIIIVPIDMIRATDPKFWNSVLLFLDIMAWIDIFFRFHIIHFNSKGVEVTHPYKTAKYYIKNGFVTDLLGVCPIEIVLMKLFEKKEQYHRYYNYNRMLQIYRLFGLLQYYNKFNLRTRKLMDMFTYIIAAMFIINFFSSFIFNEFCKYNDLMELECVNNSWLNYISKNQSGSDILRPSHTYVFALFLVTSLFGNVYYPFILTKLKKEKHMLMIISTVGYIFWMYVIANIIAINLSKNFDLVTHQDAMKSLVKFMTYRRIDKRLKNEVITHFQYIWLKKQAVQTHNIISNFAVPFRKSVLFEIFGDRVMKSKLFSLAGEPVVRSFLLHAKHENILKTGIIYSVNDVHGKVFLVYNGKVEVLGADNSHLAFLTQGAIFGNLDSFPKTRQTLTMVASGHVELLVIKSVMFHSILSKHQKIYQYFMKLISLNVDYIENRSTSKSAKETRRIKKSKKKAIVRLSEETKIMRWWRIIMIIIATISPFFEMYHMISLNHSLNFVLYLYFMDILYLIKIILKFNSAYVDEFGILNRNKIMVSQRYRKMGFYYDLASTLPIEVLSICLVRNLRNMQIAWTCLRCNRIIRLAKAIRFYASLKQKLNFNTFWVQTLNLIFVCFLYITVLCCLLFFSDSFHRQIDSHTEAENMTSAHRTKLYYMYWKVIMNMIMRMNVGYSLQYFDIYSASVMICAIIMSKFIGFYYMACVVAISQLVNRNKHLFEMFVLKMGIYMENESISYPLMKLNNRYITSLWLHYKGIQSPKLLYEAPYYLREGILNSMFGLHLRKHPIFKNCHVDLIRQISVHLKTRRFFPGDVITYIDDIDHCMYFIHEGEVHALSEDSLYNEVIEEILESGDMFGFEQGIYFRVGHLYTYKVVKNSLILVLKRDDWIFLLDYFPASKLHLYNKKT